MANNQYANKVVLGNGRTLIDLTADTVTASKMLNGVTAHDASGATITGNMLQIGDLWPTATNTNPATTLGFGTWVLIRTAEFTWGDVANFTWGQIAQDNWGWDNYKKYVYIWMRTA